MQTYTNIVSRNQLATVAYTGQIAWVNVTGKPAIPPVLTDAQIGDKAFSNPPSDLTDTEKGAARTAIGAGAGGGGGANIVAAQITTGSAGTTEADASLSVTITPSTSSKKILLTVLGGNVSSRQENDYGQVKIYKDNTQLALFNRQGRSATLLFDTVSMAVIDSPASTDAVTYKVRWAKGNSLGQTPNQYSGVFASTTYPLVLTATEID